MTLTTEPELGAVAVVHVIKGEARFSGDLHFGPRDGARFTTPAIELDELVWPRVAPGPAFEIPSEDVLDVLEATGHQLRDDPDGVLEEALERLALTSPLPRALLERTYKVLPRAFDRQLLIHQVDRELGGFEVLDGWAPVPSLDGREFQVRAFPPRLMHIMAGNAPGVSVSTIVRGALTKGVHLLKLPSNDLFTAPAVLRAMAAVAPGHPVVRSFSAVYWRGGDESVEAPILRPQFFDKIVAWGGEQAIRGALRYVGPGLELVAFDPKSSVSFIGRDAFADQPTLAQVADAAAVDATLFNQTACSSSRFMFVEGSEADADRFAEALLPRLGVERDSASAIGSPVALELREEIDSLRLMGDDFRVWYSGEGRGIVVRSAEPVDFFPEDRVVNVVAVSSLREAVRFGSVATQTVGVYPASRKAELRDALASTGVQRVVTLGGAGRAEKGLPHDGFYPLHRFVRWLTDEH